MMLRLMSLVVVLGLIVVGVGCSGEGGSAGDETDPSTTTDVEMMSDETGDVGGGDVEE